MRIALALSLAAILAPGLSFAQQSGTGTGTTPAARKHSKGGTNSATGGGRSGGGRGGGSNDSDVTALKDLPCPKGFTAQTDGGPHLVTTSQTQGAAGRRRSQSMTQSKSMGRRCVADNPPKKSSAVAASSSKSH